ncbi:hypothetical protein BCR43DRAFT_126000 [Syncephalastrum racemosum]|uniref:Dpy-30 motif-domain-containing protein n=1 Tax=Syncephalastrum racemosum TaxID=13706 RepID=A0A1X2HKY5_SYNRA|nr:hypothetical protein BCR43DRAFT_126000 [Syncephalastrum racemosum]
MDNKSHFGSNDLPPIHAPQSQHTPTTTKYPPVQSVSTQQAPLPPPPPPQPVSDPQPQPQQAEPQQVSSFQVKEEYNQSSFPPEARLAEPPRPSQMSPPPPSATPAAPAAPGQHAILARPSSRSQSEASTPSESVKQRIQEDTAPTEERMPPRAYLDSTVTPTVLEGLKLLVTERPADPLSFLGQFLLDRAAAHNKAESVKRE